ncbi:MAG: SDR family NAD(P)-dependent oxidoreductase [Alphaproteobacteria bacterium]|jgi:citronellol/citronellal dehydrogenase|nr:SDR family NAD(P)-dependent oxidoreductase [Alphaproteobacteria bacterium]MDP6833321.1 SDR family NAD(P)-dependent oxidoreductase [Alphaproteobacteria bacterium]
MTDSNPDDIYAAPTAAELAALPTVYRDDLFKDQVVLVSGGAGGIGMATAVLFGRLGATIVSCGRDEAKMAKFEVDMASLDIPCFTQALTIRDADLVGGLMAAVWERYGRLDVLINNAGGQFAAPAMDISPNGWRTVVDTNLTGSWLMMQAAARHWRDNKQPGCIINMVTVLAMCTSGIAHTQAARAGEIHLTRGLCVEWAPYDIRLNSIAIGVVSSPGLVHYPESAKPSFDHTPCAASAPPRISPRRRSIWRGRRENSSTVRC